MITTSISQKVCDGGNLLKAVSNPMWNIQKHTPNGINVAHNKPRRKITLVQTFHKNLRIGFNFKSRDSLS